MNKSSSFNVSARQKRVEQQLLLQLPPLSQTPSRLHQALAYSVLGKGKRIRPLLVYATGECFGANLRCLDIPAVAMEFMHTYSLVHDDLPAMDNDDLRRGRLTCHKAFDEATAILVGDALQNLAFELLTNAQASVTPQQQVEMVRTLAIATGPCGMIAGQHLDMQYEGQSPSLTEIEKMHSLKTGALIRACVTIGAIIAAVPSNYFNLLQQFADIIGLAFQIKDDILDHEGNTATLGKAAGADQAHHKATALTALTLTEAKEKNQKLLQAAYQCLEKLPQNTAPLRLMADYIIHRDH